MHFFKNFLPLSALAFVAAFFMASHTSQAQTAPLTVQMHIEPQAAAYIKFDGIDGECQVKEGRNIVGKNTRTGDQLILVVKGGKLVEFGVQPTRGAYKAIPANAAPCIPTLRCPNFAPPKCHTLPGGECVCTCGLWITAGGGQN